MNRRGVRVAMLSAGATVVAATAGGASAQPLAADLKPSAGDDEWVCPADPLTGDGLPVFNVLDWGATGTGDTDDRFPIQDAIEAASAAGGGVVHFPAGSYRLDSELKMRSNVIVEGVGPESVIFTNRDSYCFRYIGSFAERIRNTAIRNLQIRGPGFPSKRSSTLIGMDKHVVNARIEDCLLVDAAYDAWYALHFCSRICVLNNHVVGGYDDGLNPGGMAEGVATNDVLVRGNLIEGVAHDGIHVSDHAIAITVVENTITGCAIGVGMFRCANSLIQDNVITDCAQGIATRQQASEGMEVIGNDISGASFRGIYLWGEDGVVSGNLVRNCDLGIRVRTDSGLITDNVVEDSTTIGIELTSGGTPKGDMQLLDNTVTRVSSGDGIVLDVRCSTVMRNVVREAAVASIDDRNGYNRVLLNDVDGPVLTTPGDVDCDESVAFGDILAVLAAWGPCPGSVEECRADLDGDGEVAFADVLVILANWGG